jgi:DNA alkylation repair enzyme
VTRLQYERYLDGEEFAAAVNSRIQGLELKSRVMVITEELRLRLPDDYVTAVGVLVDSLGDELREDQGMFTESWFLMPVAHYVQEYGIE